MTSWVKKKVKLEKGVPILGTVVLDCDLIVYLDIKDNLLKERCKKRKASFSNAKKLQEWILKEVNKSKIPVINFKLE